MTFTIAKIMNKKNLIIFLTVILVVIFGIYFWNYKFGYQKEYNSGYKKESPQIEVAPQEKKVEKPYIKVISPNGGEVFKEGQDIPITWVSEGINNIYIHAYYYNDNNNIGDEFIFNSGECRLTYEPISAAAAAAGEYIVKNDGGGRCGKMPVGNKIKIEISEQATDVKDNSDNYFTITTPSLIRKDFSYPYPVSYEKEHTTTHFFNFSLTGISLGKREVPSFVSHKSPYKSGMEIYALTLYFKINNVGYYGGRRVFGAHF